MQSKNNNLQNNLKLMIVHLSNSIYSASINTLGAELINLKKLKKNYIWEVNPKFWNKTSPILFPIVGRLKEDSYTIDGMKYTMERHGFARNYEFKIIKKKANYVQFLLQENSETLQIYPFKFELKIAYLLEENRLSISYQVVNKTQKEMPFSIGGHPAFAISNGIESYELAFDNEKIIVSHELENENFSGKIKQIILNNSKLKLENSLFEKDAIVIKEQKSKYITLLQNKIPYLQMEIQKFPSLGIWTKKNAPFLCIEPWFGYADFIHSNGDFMQKEGLLILKAQKEFNTEYSITVF
jgi:galactose mutarotase-like enzyme